MLGLSLFIGQAFLYNSVFFTYALVLDKFYGVGADAVGWYIFAFAIGNFMGPLILGRFFDSVGRKPMIAGTYILSGVLLAITAVLFQSGTLTATTQTLAWCIIFFFASAGASSAYLTVSEIFPMETRAMAISFFYAVGTAIGGITGPLLFGKLIESGAETNVMYGYLLGAALMVAAGVVEIFLGVEAAQKQLEDIAKPLTAEDAEAAEARGDDVVTDDDLDVDKLKGEDAAPVEGGDDATASASRATAATRRPGPQEVRHERRRLVPVPLQLERGHRGERQVPGARGRHARARRRRAGGAAPRRARPARRLQVLGPRPLRPGAQGRGPPGADRAPAARRRTGPSEPFPACGDCRSPRAARARGGRRTRGRA